MRLFHTIPFVWLSSSPTLILIQATRKLFTYSLYTNSIQLQLSITDVLLSIFDLRLQFFISPCFVYSLDESLFWSIQIKMGGWRRSRSHLSPCIEELQHQQRWDTWKEGKIASAAAMASSRSSCGLCQDEKGGRFGQSRGWGGWNQDGAMVSAVTLTLRAVDGGSKFVVCLVCAYCSFDICHCKSNYTAPFAPPNKSAAEVDFNITYFPLIPVWSFFCSDLRFFIPTWWWCFINMYYYY